MPFGPSLSSSETLLSIRLEAIAIRLVAIASRLPLCLALSLSLSPILSHFRLEAGTQKAKVYFLLLEPWVCS